MDHGPEHLYLGLPDWCQQWKELENLPDPPSQTSFKTGSRSLH